jgi:hypothetical protein
MFTLRCLYFTCSVVLGALLSRWHGGGFFTAPKWLKNLLFALPVGLGLVFLSYESLATLGFGQFADLFAAFVATLMILGFKAMGHGGGFDLGHSKQEPGKGRDLERIEKFFFLYPKAYESLPRYWYDALILAVKGGLIAVAPAVVISFTSLLAGWFIFLSGLFGFPGAYMIGWWFYDHTKILSKLKVEPTELAEYLSGGIFFGSFVLAVFMIV